MINDLLRPKERRIELKTRRERGIGGLVKKGK